MVYWWNHNGDLAVAVAGLILALIGAAMKGG